MELLDLNEDCLIKLCRYYDAESTVAISETCLTLNRIAKSFFKHKTSYTRCIGSYENETMAAKTIRKTGKYFEKINLMFDLNYQCSNELFTLLTESVGTNLMELSILGELCFMPLNKLATTLSRLEILTFQNVCWEDDCDCEIDLPLLCPNLRELRIRGQIDFTPKSVKYFQRLEHLDINVASKQSSVEVFRQNRNLKKLSLSIRCSRTINNINLYDLTTNLVNLNELKLDVRLIQDPAQHLLALAYFRHLNTLSLYKIPAELLDGILKYLGTLSGLQKVTLQSDLTRLDVQYSSIQESLIGLATKLTALTSFVTVNIDWMSETVLEFVSEARNLIYFDFWSGSDSNYIVGATFIRKLAVIRKCLMFSEPLRLKMYAMDHDLKQVNA